jgi:hypothetical protein
LAISPIGPRLSSPAISATRDMSSLQGAGKDPTSGGGMFQRDVFESARPDRPQASRPPPQAEVQAMGQSSGTGMGSGSGMSGMMASLRAFMDELFQQLIEKLKRDFAERMKEIMG